MRTAHLLPSYHKSYHMATGPISTLNCFIYIMRYMYECIAYTDITNNELQTDVKFVASSGKVLY